MEIAPGSIFFHSSYIALLATFIFRNDWRGSKHYGKNGRYSAGRYRDIANLAPQPFHVHARFDSA